ncbi:hypothetical protein RR46_15288 [Papilio xuthus]|uniref:Uncharacterized protein n=1 Tax=Papilio xuthus TaxID=66420 RepID=A0A194PGF2_PAPXU|nr:hypothetical protein RR46_15288 [Papilio xuthus]
MKTCIRDLFAGKTLVVFYLIAFCNMIQFQCLTEEISAFVASGTSAVAIDNKIEQAMVSTALYIHCLRYQPITADG